MFVDDSSQVGVDQDGIWGFHVYLALGAFQLPCDTTRQKPFTQPERCRKEMHFHLFVILSIAKIKTKDTQILNSYRTLVQVVSSYLRDLPALRRPDLGETFRGTTE